MTLFNKTKARPAIEYLSDLVLLDGVLMSNLIDEVFEPR
jgi:hypothetical protein